MRARVPGLRWSKTSFSPDTKIERRHLDSVPPDTPIRDIVDRRRVWEIHSETHVGYRRLPTGTDNYRVLSSITGGPPVFAETPSIEPIVLRAMVRTAPLAEPTILEVLAQNILEQTVNCGEVPPTSAGSLLANFLGTPTVTEDRPVRVGSRSTGPVTQSTGIEMGSPGKSPDIEGMLNRLISVIVGPESTDQPAVVDKGLGQQRKPSLLKTEELAMVCFSCGRSSYGVSRWPRIDAAFHFLLPG